MKKIRVGIIGAGQVAEKVHLPAFISQNELCEVVAIASRKRTSAKILADKFSISGIYEDHKKMMEEMNLDAVSICVPNKTHYEITMDALKRGVHVLCEKPPALSAQEALEMEREAEKQSLLLTYGFHMRHLDEVRILKERIIKKEFGTIYHVEASWNRRRGIPGWGSFTDITVQGGGPLIDLGSHMLDLVAYLLDYPKVRYVSAHAYDYIGRQGGKGVFGEWSGNAYTVEDSLFGTVAFEDGTSLRISSTFALHQEEDTRKELSVYGSNKGAKLFPLKLISSDSDGMKILESVTESTEYSHEKMIENFLLAVQKKEALLVQAKQGTYVQKLIEKLYESAREYQPIWMEGGDHETL